MQQRDRSMVQQIATVVLISASVVGCASLGQGRVPDPGGPLQACNGGPHCVSSRDRDPARFIAPLHYTLSDTAAEQALLDTLGALPRTRVVVRQPGYIRAEVTSAIMRYVDDLEFHFQASGVIDMRSSSRIGYYDFGVNRARMEQIRAGFAARQP